MNSLCELRKCLFFLSSECQTQSSLNLSGDHIFLFALCNSKLKIRRFCVFVFFCSFRIFKYLNVFAPAFGHVVHMFKVQHYFVGVWVLLLYECEKITHTHTTNRTAFRLFGTFDSRHLAYRLFLFYLQYGEISLFTIIRSYEFAFAI